MADFVFINPEYADYLRAQGLLNLRRLLDWSEGACVGRHGPREVWQIDLADAPGGRSKFYLRKDRRVAWREILLDLLRFSYPASRSLKTMQGIAWLDQIGLETMELVCLIERQTLGLPRKAAALVTAVEGRDLYAVLRAFGRSARRRRNPLARRMLLHQLGRVLWRLHEGRLSWPDLLAKHIYVTPQGEDMRLAPTWRFAFIDVENMRPRFSAGLRTRQFEQLLASLRAVLTATDVMRIIRGYLDLGRIRARTARRRLIDRVFPLARDWCRAARDERIAQLAMPEHGPLPEEELYERIDGAVVNSRFRELLAPLHLLGGGRLFTFTAGSELHKPGLRGRLRLRFEVKGPDQRSRWLYLKRFRRPPLGDQLSRIFAGTVFHSRAWHERQIIKELGRRRIPVPTVVAWAEKMILGYERASVLVTEGIIGQSLERFVPNYFARPARGAELAKRRDWVRRLGRLIGRFHRAGYCHRDLYLSHIMISFKGNGEPVFHVIDLGRCFRLRLRRTRWIVKDLASLNYSAGSVISRSDRLRFLRGYLGRPLGPADRRLLRRILAKTAAIARRARGKNHRTTEKPHEDRVHPGTT